MVKIELVTYLMVTWTSSSPCGVTGVCALSTGAICLQPFSALQVAKEHLLHTDPSAGTRNTLGARRRWIPFTEYPFCQWQAKKEKKKSANKQKTKTCKSYWANKHRLREALPTQAGGLTIGSLNSQHQQHLRYYWKWKFLGPTPDQLIQTLRGHAVCFLQALQVTRCMPTFQKL